MGIFVQRARGAEVEAVAAIHAAKAAGCQLAILSSELDGFNGAGFRQRLPLLTLLDVIFDATYTEVLKPDPRAYPSCQQQLGVQAQDCVFMDDQPRNVAGSDRAGWQPIALDVRRPDEGFARALQALAVGVRSSRRAWRPRTGPPGPDKGPGRHKSTQSRHRSPFHHDFVAARTETCDDIAFRSRSSSGVVEVGDGGSRRMALDQQLRKWPGCNDKVSPRDFDVADAGRAGP
jgi:hypothetical protein